MDFLDGSGGLALEGCLVRGHGGRIGVVYNFPNSVAIVGEVVVQVQVEDLVVFGDDHHGGIILVV